MVPSRYTLAGTFRIEWPTQSPATSTAAVFAMANREMEQVHILDFIILLVMVVSIAAESSVKDSFCSACNCQFSNVEALDRLISAKIASRIGELAHVNHNHKHVVLEN